MFDPGLRIDQVISNKRLCEIFKCAPRGGGRVSNETKTIVLIYDYVDSIYHDRWLNNILHFTGQGLEGDQDLHSGFNHTLNNSERFCFELFLFEVRKRGEYTYRGRIEKAGKPYSETQPDKNGNDRIVWMFPVKRVN